MGRRRQIVPECGAAIDQMKAEISAELGIPFKSAGSIGDLNSEFAGELGGIAGAGAGRQQYLGHLTSREAGSVGGEITRRLVRQAESSSAPGL